MSEKMIITHVRNEHTPFRIPNLYIVSVEVPDNTLHGGYVSHPYGHIPPGRHECFYIGAMTAETKDADLIPCFLYMIQNDPRNFSPYVIKRDTHKDILYNYESALKQAMKEARRW